MDLLNNYQVLEGEIVSLRPLEVKHREALLSASSDGELSSLWFTSVPDEAKIDKYLETAFEQYKQRTALPYVVYHKKAKRIIGMTRICNADLTNRRVEIGYTWYAKSFQRTGVNTECKLLLLTHAFEKLNAIAVEFRTHWHNLTSRNAIARLGAKQDGILRNHKIHPDGQLRDTVVFSIINSEWPMVKKSLQYKQFQHR